MREDPTRRVAMAGDEITARIGVHHVANLTWLGAFFEMPTVGEEESSGLPEMILRWDIKDYDSARPDHGL